jgi:tetratricopeptide (TPR) repeat protein
MDWPDNLHFDSAVGWFQLGNAVEARVELERLGARNRLLPDALALEWKLLASERCWKEAAVIAESWVEAAPGCPEAWLQRSFALHEAKHTQQAWDKLLPAATLFPETRTIAYNLACYACQLKQLDTARRWLRRALLGITSERERCGWAVAAQQDQDLEPLWAEIRDGRLG